MGFDAARKRRANAPKQKARRLVRRVEADERTKSEYGIRTANGRKTKLDKPTYDSICRLLAEGQTLECTSTLSGVHSTTLWSWIRDGQTNPDGPFGQFARDVEYAKEVAHRFLVNKIALDEDWKAAAFLLKNKYPKLYRDSISQELQGPDGQPLTLGMQTFAVVLELHPDELVKNEQQREFRIDNGQANGAGNAQGSARGQGNGSA